MGAASLNILRARDISLSGLGVRVPHGFQARDLGSEVDLVITLPGSRSFLAKGIVRHQDDATRPHYFGVEFTELKPGNHEEIRRFLGRLAELEAPASGDAFGRE